MWDWIWLGYHGNSIQDPYVKKDHIEPTLSTFGRFIWPITWTKNSHSKTWHLPERLGFFWMPVSPLIFALLVVSQKRRFFKTECAFPERNMWVLFCTHSSRYEIMFFALEARALSKHKHLALSARALLRRYIRNVWSKWSVFRGFPPRNIWKETTRKVGRLLQCE